MWGGEGEAVEEGGEGVQILCGDGEAGCVKQLGDPLDETLSLLGSGGGGGGWGGQSGRRCKRGEREGGAEQRRREAGSSKKGHSLDGWRKPLCGKERPAGRGINPGIAAIWVRKWPTLEV